MPVVNVRVSEVDSDNLTPPSLTPGNLIGRQLRELLVYKIRIL